MRRLTVAMVVALFLGTVLSVVWQRPAEAKCCSCVSAARAMGNRVITQVNARVDVMETEIGRAVLQAEQNIVRTLQLQTAQLSGYIATAAEGNAKALDAQTKLLAQIAREEAETRSKLEHRPTQSGCEAVTGMRGLRSGRRVADRVGRQGAAAETGRITGDRGVVAQAGSDADAARRFEEFTGSYCNGGRSPEGEGVCSANEAMHGADLQPGNLLDVRTFSDKQIEKAAVELGRHLAAPVVWDPVPVRAVDTPDERRLALRARAADARGALAVDWFVRARAKRAPAAELGAWASALVPGGSFPDNISRYELMEILASRRFEDPNWAVGLQGVGTDNLLRELLMMQAAELMLAWEHYRMDEARGTMEAARLGASNDEIRRASGLEQQLTLLE